MYRVYLGNLDSRVTEETLHSLFEEHNLSVSNILVKRGYAFVDCPDQTTLDQAIDKLHGESSTIIVLIVTVINVVFCVFHLKMCLHVVPSKSPFFKMAGRP